jgi:branched-chain amino acid transport system substrate-binding protein
MLKLNRAVIAFALWSTFSTAYAQESVKIGYSGPLTGPIAAVGKYSENGVLLAIDEANAANTLIGGKPVQFILESRDDMGDPKAATTAAQRLVDDGVAGVIGHLNSGAPLPASKIYADAGVPEISPASTIQPTRVKGSRPRLE